MLNLRLYPYMEADGTGAGADTEGQTENAQQEAAYEGADEPKTGMDVKSEAQQIADGMVRKRLKGLNKEDIELFREHKGEFAQYLNGKKTAEQKIMEAQQKASQALAAAEKREAKANAMIAAAASGIKQEHLEDAVILAMARADDETTIEQAIAKIAQANPAWKTGAKLPEEGGNPAGNGDPQIAIKRHF